MTLSLEVAGRDVVVADEVIDRSIRSRTTNDGGQGVLDFTLINPEVVPNNGDGVILHDGTDLLYDGEIRSVSQRQFKTAVYVDVSCQDDNEGGELPVAAPYGLSDDPDDVTTVGFKSMTLKRTATSGEIETQGSVITMTPGFLPGMDVEITNANYSLTAEHFLIQQVGITWPIHDAPEYTLQFGDVVVRLGFVVRDIPDGSITSTHISEGAIQTPHLAANAITADKLSAILILTSLLKTSEDGARVEIDMAGIRHYDADDNLLVNIPTDGESPVSITGEIEATTLTVTGDATLRGTANVFDSDSVTTLQSYQAPPSAAPTLSQDWLTTQWDDQLDTGWDVGAFVTNQGGGSAYFDPNGGTDGTTDCYVVLVSDGAYPWIVKEYDVSTGEVVRTTTLLLLMNAPNSIVRIGSHWYVTDINPPGSGDGFQRIYKFTRSSGSWTGDFATVAGNGYGVGSTLTTDGTSIYLVYNQANSLLISSEDFVRRIYNTSLVETDADNITLPSTPSGKTWVQLMGAHIQGTALYLTFSWSVAGSNPLVYTYEYDTLATPALDADEEWLGPTGVHDATNRHSTGGLVHNGTHFYHLVYQAATGTFYLYKYENWSNGFTTATQKFWVAYAWYDSVGTTHETTVGPRASITLDRKKRLSITTAPVPGAGGADEPDNASVYMLPSASEPAAGDMELQTDIPGGGSDTRVNYVTALGFDPTSNGFSTIAGNAIIKSFASGWLFRGDGSMALGGTTFPSGPASGDQFFRTDSDMMFMYDGTRWVCTCLHTISNLFPQLTTTITATTTVVVLPAPVAPTGCTDIWLVDHTSQVFITGGGSALSASHSWIGNINKRVTGNTQTSVGVKTINSGSSGVWRTFTTNINALMNNGTLHFSFDMAWVKTGTPGAFQSNDLLTYRYVAT